MLTYTNFLICQCTLRHCASLRGDIVLYTFPKFSSSANLFFSLLDYLLHFLGTRKHPSNWLQRERNLSGSIVVGSTFVIGKQSGMGAAIVKGDFVIFKVVELEKPK